MEVLTATLGCSENLLFGTSVLVIERNSKNTIISNMYYVTIKEQSDLMVDIVERAGTN